MNTYKSMLTNIANNSANRQEVIEQFEAFKNRGVGLSVGFMEERLDYDFSFNSPEYKMYKRIMMKSYKYHDLNDELEYSIPENEFN